MNEQFKREKGSASENIEDQKDIEYKKYIALSMAMDKTDAVMKKIDNVFLETGDRAEAERIVLEKYASQMDEVMRDSRQALDEWLSAIEKASQKERG